MAFTFMFCCYFEQVFFFFFVEINDLLFSSVCVVVCFGCDAVSFFL